jgi:hypothetical protein
MGALERIKHMLETLIFIGNSSFEDLKSNPSGELGVAQRDADDIL